MNCTHFGQNIHKTNEKWRYLEIFMNKKFATWRKIPEPGNTLKDEALFTAKFQNKSTQPYDATNENLDY